jgi:glycerate kinase
MRVVMVVLNWMTTDGLPVPASAVSTAVAESWRDAAPHVDVTTFALGDGGPRSADAMAGARTDLGGVESTQIVAGVKDGAVILAPSGHDARWNPADLATGLVRLAERARAQGRTQRVIVPVGDVDCAGDATILWGAGESRGALLETMRSALETLEIVVLTSTDRPLLGFHGMSSALRDGREADEALAIAAQRQEERWTAIAREVDPLLGRQMLIGPSRLSDVAGTGAAAGLAYCLGAVGARVVTDSTGYLAELSGVLGALDSEVAVAVAVSPTLTPGVLDHGIASSLARSASAVAVPVVVIAPEVHVGKRDLMAAGLAASYEAGAGLDALVEQVRRVALTWTPRR